MEKIYLNTIYLATEGEGVNIGRPQVFIRYQGCAVGCVNCDSMETWPFTEDRSHTIDDILQKVESLTLNAKIKWVSITGGDPLHPKHTPGLLKLVAALKEKKYMINLEAAGTRVVGEIFDLVDYISFDIKTPSTKVETPFTLLIKCVQQYSHKMQIKAVVSDRFDFDYFLTRKQALEAEVGEHSVPMVMTPAYNLGSAFPRENFIELMKLNESAGAPFRFIGQQHKWFFGPDATDV